MHTNVYCCRRAYYITLKYIQLRDHLINNLIRIRLHLNDKKTKIYIFPVPNCECEPERYKNIGEERGNVSGGRWEEFQEIESEISAPLYNRTH